MRAFATFSLLAGLAFVAGCGETSTEPASETKTSASTESEVVVAVNEVCPIMGGKVKDDGGRATYEGQNVGFCCPGCIEKWEDLSAEDKKTKLADSMKAADDSVQIGTESATMFTALTGAAKKSSCCSAAGTETKGSCCSAATTATAKSNCCSATTTAAKSCCAASKDATTAPANTSVASNANCPIMASPVKAGGGSAEWNGKTVGFCCPGCVKKWNDLSEDEKAQKMTEANPASEKVGA